MSNLGGYQIMTTMAKKVGGPKQLIELLIVGGAVLGGGVVLGGSAVKKKITSELDKKKQAADAEIIYTVKTEGDSNEGLHFSIGDKFKVLEVDGDAGLIELIGNGNNPYFVSRIFLSTISDYKVR